ncbi:hypothetical protein BABINDRAFT_160748 [Babjeviella inositovora NRRL Y-12698]|uniref:Uncharacterized protein n=1 Tax=Babjeviella inositovora NRRL Y-12698 TaxID=984486 RepID=A0A1E3QU60_9ASCO|nr:uncharacterized protein BABINDRAFT_160748 [Babjeviella inositovora NRRL Y-12698]ODQ80467.1 hypothetical protein BABINDRAFT_160748 [Babjeviella inositovora NRRL Y-12698]
MSNITELAQPPVDLISSCRLSPTYPHLLVSAWDGTVSLYDADILTAHTRSGPMVRLQNQSSVLDTTFDLSLTGHGRKAYYGSLDGSIGEIDFENNALGGTVGKKHTHAVSAVKSIPGLELLVAGSWDKSLQYVDVRSPSTDTVTLPGKVFSMDANEKNVIVAMSDRIIHIYDLRSPRQPFQIRESGLKYQTKDIEIMPTGEGYVQSSIEGRISVEWIDPSDRYQSQKYAFKCHRLSSKDAGGADVDNVTSVNALSFHPRHYTLFTAGSDGHVCIWDFNTRKRLKQYSKLDLPVLHLSTAERKGQTMMALCTGDESFKRLPKEEVHGNVHASQPAVKSRIYLKGLADNEGMPKKVNGR